MDRRLHIIRKHAAAIVALLALSACANAATRSAEAARLAAGNLPVCAAADPRTVYVGGDTVRARRELTAAGLMEIGAPLVLSDSFPVLANPQEVAPMLLLAYPPNLRDRGIGGRAVLVLRVDEAGDVSHVVVWESSGNDQLDAAAMGVARQLRFVPAVNSGCRHPGWVRIPLGFESWGGE